MNKYNMFKGKEALIKVNELIKLLGLTSSYWKYYGEVNIYEKDSERVPILQKRFEEKMKVINDRFLKLENLSKKLGYEYRDGGEWVKIKNITK